jgi:hypothetical protein
MVLRNTGVLPHHGVNSQKTTCLLCSPVSLLSNGYQGLFRLGVKRPGRESDHSPPSSAEVKECVDIYFHSPNTP